MNIILIKICHPNKQFNAKILHSEPNELMQRFTPNIECFLEEKDTKPTLLLSNGSLFDGFPFPMELSYTENYLSNGKGIIMKFIEFQFKESNEVILQATLVFPENNLLLTSIKIEAKMNIPTLFNFMKGFKHCRLGVRNPKPIRRQLGWQ